jgi:hypothetical protein
MGDSTWLRAPPRGWAPPCRVTLYLRVPARLAWGQALSGLHVLTGRLPLPRAGRLGGRQAGGAQARGIHGGGRLPGSGRGERVLLMGHHEAAFSVLLLQQHDLHLEVCHAGWARNAEHAERAAVVVVVSGGVLDGSGFCVAGNGVGALVLAQVLRVCLDGLALQLGWQLLERVKVCCRETVWIYPVGEQELIGVFGVLDEGLVHHLCWLRSPCRQRA